MIIHVYKLERLFLDTILQIQNSTTTKKNEIRTRSKRKSKREEVMSIKTWEEEGSVYHQKNKQ